MPATEASTTTLPLVDSLLLPNPDAVPVIHPDFKELGRLWIPLAAVLPTSGLQRLQCQHPHSPSLCTLFQKGKCRSRDRCNQVHVVQDFAHRLGAALRAHPVSTCCRRHGDPPSLAGNPFEALARGAVELRVAGQPSVRVPVDLIATTFFWHRLSRERRPALFFPLERLCVLHQRGQCTFGAECRNVHVCREWWAQAAVPLPTPVSRPASTQEPERKLSGGSSEDAGGSASEEVSADGAEQSFGAAALLSDGPPAGPPGTSPLDARYRGNHPPATAGAIGQAATMRPPVHNQSTQSLFSFLPDFFTGIRSPSLTPTLPSSPCSVANLSFDGSDQVHFEVLDDLQFHFEPLDDLHGRMMPPVFQ